MRTLTLSELDRVSGGAQAIVAGINTEQGQLTAVNLGVAGSTSPNVTIATTTASSVLTVASAEFQKASSSLLAAQLA